MSRPRLVAFFFLASGFSGLVYQVVWTRAAGLALGNTTAAIGTVVAVFMGGLALGSAIAGRVAARRNDLLRLYGLLEVAIGIFGAAVPCLFLAFGRLSAALYGSPVAFGAARVLLCAIVLLPPTTLMGATLPLLVQGLARDLGDAARASGILYALNSFGAAAGAFIAGLVLIPGAGLQVATFVAAGINLAVGLAAIALGRRPSTGSGQAPSLAEAAPAALSARARLAIIAYALSGFSALVYEIAWTRAITLAIGSTVYAFTLILGSFISGLALGSLFLARRAARLADPLRTIAVIQLLIGAWSLGLIWFLEELPIATATLVLSYADHFAMLQFIEFTAIIACILVPCTLMGALLPLVMAAVAPAAGDAGRAMGRVYAWNTVCCIAGSLAASFLMIPLLGIDWTLRLATVVNLVVAAVAGGGRRVVLALSGAATLVAILLPRWDMRVTSSGPYMYGGLIKRIAERESLSMREAIAKKNNLLGAYWDSYGLVTVHSFRAGELSLRINGKNDASTGSIDMTTQLFAAHVPMALHDHPRDVLIVGLGSGITFGHALQYPVDAVECVEISPAVARAGVFFAPHNGDPLGNPKARLILNDGRAHMRYARTQYDVIISEPSNLWVSGMSTLFTREFFRDVRARLRPGGVFAQWIHAYKLGPEEFRAVARTVLDVFSEVWLWEVCVEGDYLLVAFPDERRPGYEGLEARIRAHGLPPEIQLLGVRTPVDFLAHFALDAAGTRAFAAGAAAITDDDCWVEYTAPKSLYVDHRIDIVKLLDPLRRSPAHLLAGCPPDAAQALEKAAEARRQLSRALVARSSADRAKAMDAAVRARPEDGLIRFYADELGAQGLEESRQRRRHIGVDMPKKLEHALEPLTWIPKCAALYPKARCEAGHCYLAAGQATLATRLYREALQLRPDMTEAMLGLAQALAVNGMLDDAKKQCEAALARDPQSVEAHVTLGRILLETGDVRGARDELERALEIQKDHPDALRFKMQMDRIK